MSAQISRSFSEWSDLLHPEDRNRSSLAGDISLALEHIGNEERLKFLANYDPLTGLPNRALIPS